jgi:hypothetical protein
VTGFGAIRFRKYLCGQGGRASPYRSACRGESHAGTVAAGVRCPALEEQGIDLQTARVPGKERIAPLVDLMAATVALSSVSVLAEGEDLGSGNLRIMKPRAQNRTIRKDLSRQNQLLPYVDFGGLDRGFEVGGDCGFRARIGGVRGRCRCRFWLWLRQVR